MEKGIKTEVPETPEDRWGRCLLNERSRNTGSCRHVSCSTCGFNVDEFARRTALLRERGLSTDDHGREYLDLSKLERSAK